MHGDFVAMIYNISAGHISTKF